MTDCMLNVEEQASGAVVVVHAMNEKQREGQITKRRVDLYTVVNRSFKLFYSHITDPKDCLILSKS